jgi:WD40 repeat protein
MDHPNIARVLDAGTTDSGRPYFVMELVKGVPITKYCDEQRLTPRERLELFVPVCQAVQHAHQKGILHRDLKPANVLVARYDDTSVPKVIDFGIAKATGPKLTERTVFTELGAVVGTLEYMSPEQAELNQLDVDTRSDIYSLGVLLYELLTGTTPLERKRLKAASLLESLRAIREEEPPRPSTRLSTTEELPSIAANRGLEPRKLSGLVRGELDWIVMKCLEKDRGRRYETANGLARDLERYLNDEPVQACPPSAGYRFRKLVRRHKAAVLATAAVAALLVVGVVVSTVLAVWAIRAEGLAEDRLKSEKTERERAVAAERERKRQLVHAKLAQARAGRWSRQPGQRFDGLKVLTEAAALARELGMDRSVFGELRDEMIACLALVDVRLIKGPWEGWPAGSSAGLGFDADLERYARTDHRANIEVRQVEGDRLLARLTGNGSGEGSSGADSILFSPDGSLLAVQYWHQVPGQPTNLQVWDWERKKVVFQPPFPVPAFLRSDFRPDGQRLAVPQKDGTVIVYAVDGWREVNQLKTGSPLSTLAFHPNGTRVAVASKAGTIAVWEVATAKPLYKVSAPGCCSLAWHPRGDLLAAGCGPKVHLWDGATGQPHTVLSGQQNIASAVAFAAGGDILVSNASDGTSWLWDPWLGRELLRFTGDARHASRDGRRLASRAGHSLAVWHLSPGQEYLPIAPGRTGALAGLGGISPDGRWMVGRSRRYWALDLALRKQVGPPPASGYGDGKFHPTRRELFTSGQIGLHRWSFEVTDEALRVRPTSRLLPPGNWQQISLDREGERLAIVRAGGTGAIAILNLKGPASQALLLNHINPYSVSLSPDGRWVAAGAFHGYGIKVWDARTGKVETELIRSESITKAVFSPDGRWLLSATGTEYGVWEPVTWRLARRLPRVQTSDIPAGAAFAPDGKVLAIAVSRTEVQFLDTEAWQPLARLQGPDADLIAELAFTPEGDRLLVRRQDNTVRVWDLRRIREQLAEAGLDWERPAYPPTPPRGDVKPLWVEVDVP